MAASFTEQHKLHLLNLPEDLLYCIIDWIAESDIYALKQLRLTNRRIGSLDHVLRSLFRTLSLSFDNLQHNGFNLDAILPCVREVAFKCTAGRNEYQGSILEGSSSSSTLPAAYKRLYLSGAAEIQIVEILERLPNLRSASITTSTPPMDHLNVPPLNYLVHFATECLLKAEVKLEQLTFNDFAERTMTHFEVPEAYRTDWRKLDLGSLKNFSFNVKGGLAGDQSTGRAMQSLGDTLRTISTSLERLSVDAAQIGFLYPRYPVALPCLRFLHLSECKVVQEHLASWLSRCPKLETFTLVRIHSETDTWLYYLDVWKPVFTVLRDHPSRMNIVFDDLWIYYFDVMEFDFFTKEDHASLSMSCHTSRGHVDSATATFGEAEEFQMVANYMAGVGEWDLATHALAPRTHDRLDI